MWEPNVSSSSSSNNRGFILLGIALSLCILLYKAWGPLLLITCALVLVVHTCYSLLVNDSLLAPHTLVLLRYTRELGLEIAQTIKVLLSIGLSRFREIIKYFKQKYSERIKKQQKSSIEITEENMNGRNRNVYRLSTMGSESTEQMSPMTKEAYHLFAINGSCDIARTSTPLPKETWKNDVQQNGNLGQYTPLGSSPAKKIPYLRSENKRPISTVPCNEETLHSPKGSPWGSNSSPKIRDRASGVKTVQTIAGPLLASTRFNIDPKVYTDISSPGLTTRLTKYATEANNKLTHQSQYGTGQFPKVNLNAIPTPLLSPKVVRARMPVTVRVAPPEMTSYSPPDTHFNQEKQKNFSSEPKETKSCPNVAQVLKEISLKRHASREDIMLDLAKKQRTDRLTEDQLENLEEMMQKRARDESMTSDSETSPQTKTERPTKRSKASSCHDILNSLSSSINVFSGVKRKAMDTSRCNTPDIEKHFKPSTKSPNKNLFPTLKSTEVVKSKEQLNVKVPIMNNSEEFSQYKTQQNIPEIVEKNQNAHEKQQTSTLNTSYTSKNNKDISVPSKTSKLTEKLFMRASPQNNEKLKNLIKEQESLEPKFTSDDRDEIKKQDIVNMRQNSMRLRLQSMFNAISGKSASKIDPDVVIQAEEVNLPTSGIYTSLNSSTSTTTINTSPITTTIVPILKTDTESKPLTTKHVSFNLPNTTSSLSDTTSNTSSCSSKELEKPAEKNLLSSGISNLAGFSNFNSSTPAFNIDNSATTASNSVSSSTAPVQTSASGFTFSASSNSSTSPTTTSAEVKTTTVSSRNSMLIAPKSTTENVKTTFSVSSPGFSFGDAANATSTTTSTSLSSISSFGTINNAPTSQNSETKLANNSMLSFNNALSNNSASTQTASTSSFGSDKKESGFFFGATALASVNNTANSQPSIFGVSATPAFSTNSNAKSIANNTTTSNAVATSLPVSTTASVAPTFNFGTVNKPGSTFSFGGISAGSPTTTASTSALSSTFGGTAQTLTSANPTNTTVTFASPTISSATCNSTVSASKPTSTFESSMPSIFGTPTNSQSLFSGSSTPESTSMFKSPTTLATTTTGSIFGSQTIIPTFGAPSIITTTTSTIPSLFGNNTMANPTMTTTPSLFGSNVTTTSTTTSMPSSFGGNVSINPINNTTSNLFGNTTNSTAVSTIPSLFGNTASPVTTTNAAPTISAFGGSNTQQPGSIFSGINTTTTANSSIFGSTTLSAAPSGGFFSGTNASTAKTNESSNIFGQAKSPTLSFNATNSTFGLTNTPSSFPAPNTNNASSAFQIGGNAPSSSNLPSFGSIKPTTQFGAPSDPSPQTNTGSSIFGSTTSSFDANTNSTLPAFGSSASSNAFGMQNNANGMTPAFGTGVSSFGSSTAGASSSFGAQTTTASTTLFGNTASSSNITAGASTGATFSFGSSQQPQQQQPQQPTSSFSFGGASNTNTSNSGGLFQFGSTSNANKPAGFNFNAPTSTPAINFTAGAGAPNFNAGAPGAPSAFNAPATNMFSIGSGSSTPRSRTSRTRRPR